MFFFFHGFFLFIDDYMKGEWRLQVRKIFLFFFIYSAGAKNGKERERVICTNYSVESGYTSAKR